MANRFRLHGKAYFEFITTPGIDPTNNVAEQAMRFVVIDRLITQGTRSVKGRQSNFLHSIRLQPYSRVLSQGNYIASATRLRINLRDLAF